VPAGFVASNALSMVKMFGFDPTLQPAAVDKPFSGTQVTEVKGLK
jgi:hypothetical protein